ncbi:MAG: GNAT family N-acetyltransferase [Gaiellaceae bacterium]|nr:GNAT family N-acetyltransferase [Acidobacteriota bacterium]
MSIRPATENDGAALRPLYDAFQAEVAGPPALHEQWDDAWGGLRPHIAQGLGFVAEADGRIAGFVFGTIDHATPQLCRITDLYVVADARRRGIGRALLRAVVDELARRDVMSVSLDVMLDNAAALAFYKRFAFAPFAYSLIAPRESLGERLASEARPTSVASLHVQTDDAAAVERAIAQFMPRLGRSDWTRVEASAHDWTVVTDELCDRDRSAQRRLGAELSDRMGVPAVAFAVEEEAVVRFLLFDRGRMVDEYLSVPTYYGELNKADELSLAANPTLAARLTGADPARIRAVARVASSPAELPQPRELLAQIAAAMNLEARIER